MKKTKSALEKIRPKMTAYANAGGKASLAGNYDRAVNCLIKAQDVLRSVSIADVSERELYNFAAQRKVIWQLWLDVDTGLTLGVIKLKPNTITAFRIAFQEALQLKYCDANRRLLVVPPTMDETLAAITAQRPDISLPAETFDPGMPPAVDY